MTTSPLNLQIFVSRSIDKAPYQASSNLVNMFVISLVSVALVAPLLREPRQALPQPRYPQSQVLLPRCMATRIRMDSDASARPDIALDADLLETVQTAMLEEDDAGSCAPSEEPLSETITAFNRGLIGAMKGAIDAIYAGRDFQRFYVLETIARVPYFSYLSCLHLYESLGARDSVHRMRTHYAEADNELHHLLIMEELGGSDAFVDRFLAQHMAFAYFWYCVVLYLLDPRAAYHLSELVEEHAYHTYEAFLAEHEDELKQRPVPAVAARYYGGSDALEAFMRQGDASRMPRELTNLYDVFCEVRDDEGAHWKTLVNLVQRDELEAPEGCAVIGTVARHDMANHMGFE